MPIQIRARSRREEAFRHVIRMRDHEIVVDEPTELGGGDAAPTPQELLAASLAGCTAITLQMYAQRKGWDIGDLEVECHQRPAERGRPTAFEVTLRVDESLTDEQVDRLRVIATKCPVHRILDGEVMFDERVERVGSPR
ncbi:MAG: OsmC family protein [Solirubrobacteraceae bacterium]|nr:OsmC family protein [Solirubrobacteraceae bacterium]